MVGQKFPTQFDARDRVVSNPGSRVRVTYGPVFDDHGHMTLKQKGQENLYEYIQSFKDSCNIDLILKRFEAGDVSVLARVQGTYGDFTEFPKTYAEMFQRMHDAEALFNSLPVEVRNEFHHSLSEFLAASCEPDFAARLGVSSPAGGETVPESGAEPKPEKGGE